MQLMWLLLVKVHLVVDEVETELQSSVLMQSENEVSVMDESVMES